MYKIQKRKEIKELKETCQVNLSMLYFFSIFKGKKGGGLYRNGNKGTF